MLHFACATEHFSLTLALPSYVFSLSQARHVPRQRKLRRAGLFQVSGTGVPPVRIEQTGTRARRPCNFRRAPSQIRFRLALGVPGAQSQIQPLGSKFDQR